jgi:hypothetical protein
VCIIRLGNLKELHIHSASPGKTRITSSPDVFASFLTSHHASLTSLTLDIVFDGPLSPLRLPYLNSWSSRRQPDDIQTAVTLGIAPKLEHLGISDYRQISQGIQPPPSLTYPSGDLTPYRNLVSLHIHLEKPTWNLEFPRFDMDEPSMPEFVSNILKSCPRLKKLSFAGGWLTYVWVSVSSLRHACCDELLQASLALALQKGDEEVKLEEIILEQHYQKKDHRAKSIKLKLYELAEALLQEVTSLETVSIKCYGDAGFLDPHLKCHYSRDGNTILVREVRFNSTPRVVHALREIRGNPRCMEELIKKYYYGLLREWKESHIVYLKLKASGL